MDVPAATRSASEDGNNFISVAATSALPISSNDTVDNTTNLHNTDNHFKSELVAGIEHSRVEYIKFPQLENNYCYIKQLSRLSRTKPEDSDEVKELEKRFLEKCWEVQSLKDEKKELNDRIQQLLHDTSKYKKKIDDLESTVADLTKRVSIVEKSLHEKEHEKLKLENELLKVKLDSSEKDKKLFHFESMEEIRKVEKKKDEEIQQITQQMKSTTLHNEVVISLYQEALKNPKSALQSAHEKGHFDIVHFIIGHRGNDVEYNPEHLFGGLLHSEKWVDIKYLNAGCYSVVLSATHSLDKRKCAIKVVKHFDVSESSTKDVVLNEVRLLSQLDHENIVRYHYPVMIEVPKELQKPVHKFLKEGPETCKLLLIIMELCDVNLEVWMKAHLQRKIQEIVPYFEQALEGLAYIQSKNITHGDLKSSNVFLSANKVKIGDFGVATRKSKGTASGSQKPVSDISSLGVIFFDLCYVFQNDQERIKTLHHLASESTDDSGLSIEQRIVRVMICEESTTPTAKDIQNNLLPTLKEHIEKSSIHQRSSSIAVIL